MDYNDKTLSWGKARTSLTFLALVFGCVLFFGGIGFQFTSSQFSPDDPNGMRLLQFSVALGLFVMPPLIFAQLASNHPTTFLGLRPLPTYSSAPFSRKNAKPLPPNWHVFPALALVAFGAFYAIDLLGRLNHLLPDSSWAQSLIAQERLVEATLEKLLGNPTPTTLLANLVVMVLLPAFGEELFFRGILQKLFHRSFNHHIAIGLTAFFFAFSHQQPLSFLPILFMGFLLGYAKLWTGSLWAPILLHMINNGYALVSSYLAGGTLPSAAEASPHIALSLVGLVALSAGVVWLQRLHARHTAWLR